jgi:oligopeptide transport system permease protein
MAVSSAEAISTEELEEKYSKSEKELFSVAEYRHDAAESVAFSDYSYWKSVWKIFISKKRVKILLVLFIALVGFSFIAEKISAFDYATLHSNFADAFKTPNSTYWFGTDNLGRDYWVQVWGATLISIKLSGMVAIGECVIGVIMGCIWGYVRSLDRFFTELYNLINNIPSIIYMTIIALFVGRTLATLTIAMIAVGWLHTAKQIRGLVFLYRDREFNLASRCLGTRTGTILVKNLIPYLVSVIFLNFSMSIPGTISMETTLSYLGLGLGVDTPSLGILLRNARGYFVAFPHLLVFPALIVALITITFYLLGNAFSDACDPRNHV